MRSPVPSIVQQITAALGRLRHLTRDQARTMPTAYYTSPEFTELEKDELFRREWICIGHEGEIPTSGDYFTTELVDEQLLVVRGADDCVRVLSNVCRHRGNVVARGAGNTRRFTCGYHAWSYELDGKLIAAPRMDGLNKTNCSLPQFAVERWRGFIFVNLNGEAQHLQMALRDLEPMLHNYHPQERHFLYGTEDKWATNWKCLVENFMEGYHLSSTHSKTLNAITPTALCEKLPNSLAFTGYRANYNPAYPENGTHHPDLSLVEGRSSVLYCIFPSFVASFSPHFTEYMCLRPLTVDSVGVRWGVVGVEENPESPGVKEELRLLREVYAEDRAMLEGLQKGLRTHYYNQGPLAGDNVEGTIWDILQYMATRLGSDQSVGAASPLK